MLRVLISRLLATVLYTTALLGLGVATVPDTFAQPDLPETKKALQEAGEVLRDPDTKARFDSALEESAATPLPDSRGLLRWLGSHPSESTNLGALREDKDRMREFAPHAGEARYASRVFVFVSFSMPEIALRNLFNAAAPRRIPLVLRGFVSGSNNTVSLAATQRRLYDVLGATLGQHERGGILIDPTLFDRFDIRQVPAFVMTTEIPTACDQEKCKTPDNYQLFGDVTLDFALERLSREMPDLGG